MPRVVVPVILAAAVSALAAQSAPPPLDARASDPVAMGWMVGAPPPPEKIVRFEDDSWFQFPQTRWSFSHVRELMPTRAVGRGNGPASVLPRGERREIDTLTFQPTGRSEPMTWAASLEANYTDGIVVVHRGRIVYERYFGALTADRPHLAFSVTKSVVATMAAAMIHEGALKEHATVGSYVPELRASGIGDATIRQLLDMTTGLTYSEDYVDRSSAAWDLSRAGGFLARPPGYRGPASFFEYLQGLVKAGRHGQTFSYKTVNADALAAVMRRVSGRSLATLVSERIFARIGADHDGFFPVDSTGVEFAGGGLNLTLRDLARFGELIRLDGRVGGQQVLPKAAIDDIRRGGDRARFAQAGYKMLPGWSYRSMWWISHDAHGVFMARGVYGQALYIDPAAEMVIARFASHPLAANVHSDPTSLPAYEAVANYLMR